MTTGHLKRFPEKLRTLRQQKGLSLRQLATMLGHASHSYVTGMERGERKPNAEVLIELSRIFGVSVDVMIKDELELP